MVENKFKLQTILIEQVKQNQQKDKEQQKLQELNDEQIQQQLYNRLNQFLIEFQINKSKLSNMDTILQTFEEMKPFIIQLNDLKEDNICKNLSDLKLLLPQFFEDLNLMSLQVNNLEEKSKIQYQQRKFDQLSLTIEMSRNCDKCAQLFKRRNTSHQQLVDYLHNLIQHECNEINQLLEQKQFNSHLGQLLDNLDNCINCFKGEHQIFNDCNFKKRQIEQFILNLLSLYKQEFKLALKNYKNNAEEQFVQQMGDNILNGLSICYKIQQFSKNVDNFIINCTDQLEMDEYFILFDYLTNGNLQADKQIMFQELISNNPNFSFFDNVNFRNEVLKTHDINYILQQLQQSDINQDTQPNKDELDTLRKLYEQCDLIKNQVIQKYLLKKDRVQLLLGEIANAKTSFKDNIENLDKTLLNLLYLIAYIFTLWQFIEINYKFQIQKFETAQRGLKFPHCAQIISVFLILGLHQKDGLQMLLNEFEYSKQQNIAIQCLTGQGKSLILAVSAAMLVIVKDICIDIGCFSEYLTNRDEEDFKYFFELLEVSERVKYGTLLKLVGNMMNQDGDIRFASATILTKDEFPQIYKQQQQKRGFLLDEYDTIGQQEFYGNTLDVTQIIQIEEFIEIQKFIWQNKNLSQQGLQIQVEKLQAYKNLIQNKSEWFELFMKHISLMILCVKNMDTYLKNSQYFVKDKKIGYKLHDMEIKQNVYDGYFTVFAHFREKEEGEIPQEELNNIMGMHLACGHFSYAELLKKYCFIKGVTETLKTQHKSMRELLKQYFSKNYLIPSMFKSSQLYWDVEKNLTLHQNKDDQYLKIFNLANDSRKNQQAVQIYFNSDNEIQEYLTYLKKKGHQIQDYLILDSKTEKKEQIIKESTRSGQITLIIKDYGRGTDYKVFDQVVKTKGGVVIIQTFFSLDQTEEKQIQGRTARQNNEGQYYMCLFVQDLSKALGIHEQYMTEMIQSPSTVYKKLDEIRLNRMDQQIQNLIKNQEIAIVRHNETLEYKNQIDQNKLQEAKITLKKIGIKDIERNVEDTVKPFHYLFVIDVSASMRNIDYQKDGNKKNRLSIVLEALQIFLKYRISLTQGIITDKISIITYGEKAKIVIESQDLTEIIQLNPEFENYTFFHCALQKVDDIIKIVKQTNNNLQTKVYFLSDGEDNSPKQQMFNELIKIVSNHKMQIESWSNRGFGPNSAMGVLNQMLEYLKDIKADVLEVKNAQDLNKDIAEHASIKIVKKVQY